MTKKFDFKKKYTFEDLSDTLRSDNLEIDEWVSVFIRLYPAENMEKKDGEQTGNISFFAQEINKYRRSRIVTERVSKIGIAAVMLGGLLWLTELAATTVLGCASLTLYTLNLAFNFLSPIIFNPKIGFPEGKVQLTAEQTSEWAAYRNSWLKRVELTELSKENEQRQMLTKAVGSALVLTFAAGLILTTEVMSGVLVAHAMIFISGLIVSAGNSAVTEKYNFAPEMKLTYQTEAETDEDEHTPGYTQAI
jgi:hypothetical protein